MRSMPQQPLRQPKLRTSDNFYYPQQMEGRALRARARVQ